MRPISGAEVVIVAVATIVAVIGGLKGQLFLTILGLATVVAVIVIRAARA